MKYYKDTFDHCFPVYIFRANVMTYTRILTK